MFNTASKPGKGSSKLANLNDGRVTPNPIAPR
jgi:hypothetical protein